MGKMLPVDSNTDGGHLRLARQMADLTLADIGEYDTGYLSRVERNFLPVTPGILAAYERATGRAITLPRPITTAVVPCIFPQADSESQGRQTWVRVEPSNWGLSIAIFKDRPTRHTPEWQAMAVVHIDPCFLNQALVQLWDERQDSERDEGRWITLVAQIDGWKLPASRNGTPELP
jgi:hypothetical protein